MIERSAVLRGASSPPFVGYRKVVRKDLRRAFSSFRTEAQANPLDEPVRRLEKALREFKSINPDVWNGINDAYQALVDKKYVSGLDPEEDARMERLGVALDRLMEPYDLARIEFIESRSPLG